jgi:hypothetical protein
MILTGFRARLQPLLLLLKLYEADICQCKKKYSHLKRGENPEPDVSHPLDIAYLGQWTTPNTITALLQPITPTKVETNIYGGLVFVMKEKFILIFCILLCVTIIRVIVRTDNTTNRYYH